MPNLARQQQQLRRTTRQGKQHRYAPALWDMVMASWEGAARPAALHLLSFAPLVLMQPSVIALGGLAGAMVQTLLLKNAVFAQARWRRWF